MRQIERYQNAGERSHGGGGGGGVMMYRYNRMRKEKATFLSSSKEELQCRQDSRQYKR